MDLKLPDWNPTKQELMVFSAAMHRLAEKALPFERLDVSADLAMEMFKDNQYKSAHIPGIAKKSSTGESGLFLDPVSYTHLTLPTIYSV